MKKLFIVFFLFLITSSGWGDVFYSASITHTGIYRIISEKKFSVFFNGRKLPELGTLTPEYFFHWKRTPFSLKNEILMKKGSSPPMRVVYPLNDGIKVSYYRRNIKYEKEYYLVSYPVDGTTTSHWYWGYVGSGGGYLPPYGNFGYNLQDFFCSPDTLPVNIKVYGMAAYMPSSSGIVIKVNNRLFYSKSVTDYKYHILTYQIPCKYVGKQGLFALQKTVGGGVFWIDKVVFDYPSFFSLSTGRITFTLLKNSCFDLYNYGKFFYLLKIDDLYKPAIISLPPINKNSRSIHLCLASGRYFAQLEKKIEAISPVKHIYPSIDFLPEPDYLIITYPSFVSSEALSKLVDKRVKEGLKTLIVTTDEIYGWFSEFNKSPWAIVKFLRYMKKKWVRFPKYLLLVGLSTSAPRNDIHTPPGYAPYMEGKWDLLPAPLYRARNENPNVIFPYYDVGSDFYYADPDDDEVIDYYVGRLPVTSETELANIVNKINLFENHISSRVVIVNDRDANGFDFSVFAGEIKSMIPEAFPVERVDLTKLDMKEANKEVIDDFSLGGRLLLYTGHGFYTFWSAIYQEPPYYLLSVDYSQGRYDPALMKLPTSPFILFQLTCFANSIYWHIIPGSLGRALLVAKTGVSASIGANDYSDYSAQKIFAHYLIPQFFIKNNTRLGQAFYRGLQLYLADHPEGREMAYTYPLLGDPAMLLWGSKSYKKNIKTYGKEQIPSLLPEKNSKGGGCSQLDGVSFMIILLLPVLLWMLSYLRKLLS